MAELYQMDIDQVKGVFSGDNLDYFKRDVVITKTIDWLYDNAKIKKVKPEAKRAKKEAEDEEK